MSKKIFFCDLDGTLLNCNHTLSDENLEIITKAREQGHIFCIATGRSWNESKWVYEKLNLDTPIINTNGSHVHNPNSNDWEERLMLFDNNIMSELLNSKYVNKNCTGCYIEGMDSYYTHNVPDKFIGEKVRLLKHHDIKDMKSEISIEGRILSGIIVFDTKEHMDEFNKYLEKYEGLINWWGWSLNFDRDMHCVEVNTISTKASFMDDIIKHYNIDAENVYAFGDQRNDLEMIKRAKYGYAMKNAQQVLFDNTDLVTANTNNESGVGMQIKEILDI